MDDLAVCRRTTTPDGLPSYIFSQRSARSPPEVRLIRNVSRSLIRHLSRTYLGRRRTRSLLKKVFLVVHSFPGRSLHETRLGHGPPHEPISIHNYSLGFHNNASLISKYARSKTLIEYRFPIKLAYCNVTSVALLSHFCRTSRALPVYVEHYRKWFSM